MDINRKCAELSYKSEDKKITFSELNQDMNMEEFHQRCKELAAAVGYADGSIQEWFESDLEVLDKLDILERKISVYEQIHAGKLDE
tara:strand:- start:876 stop:1133 length:258 start_codon:yes stop_codon:yes gene_type:complete